MKGLQRAFDVHLGCLGDELGDVMMHVGYVKLQVDGKPGGMDEGGVCSSHPLCLGSHPLGISLSDVDECKRHILGQHHSASIDVVLQGGREHVGAIRERKLLGREG